MFASLSLLVLPALALAAPTLQTRNDFNGNPGEDPSEVVAAFEPDTTQWYAGGNDRFQVWGNSCNTTQLELIGDGLAETVKLVEHARAHLRRFGNDT